MSPNLLIKISRSGENVFPISLNKLGVSRLVGETLAYSDQLLFIFREAIVEGWGCAPSLRKANSEILYLSPNMIKTNFEKPQ